MRGGGKDNLPCRGVQQHGATTSQGMLGSTERRKADPLPLWGKQNKHIDVGCGSDWSPTRVSAPSDVGTKGGCVLRDGDVPGGLCSSTSYLVSRCRPLA